MNTKQLRRTTLSAAMIAGLSVAGAAQAATDTTTFQVTATVVASCNVSATDLAFGNYDPTAATDLDATSTVTANCTNGTTYDIGLDAGTGTPVSTTRAMLGGTNGDFLDYELYEDAARTDIWDNTLDVQGTGDGSAAGVSHTVYGRIPALQNISADGYTDTITVTLTY